MDAFLQFYSSPQITMTESDYYELQRMIDVFQADDWKGLLAVLSARSRNWLKILVKVLNGSSRYQLAILTRLLNNDDEDLICAAAKTLTEQECNLCMINNTEEIDRTILKLMPGASPRVAKQLQELLTEYKKQQNIMNNLGIDPSEAKQIMSQMQDLVDSNSVYLFESDDPDRYDPCEAVPFYVNCSFYALEVQVEKGNKNYEAGDGFCYTLSDFPHLKITKLRKYTC